MEDIFSTIVALCRNRILNHLGLPLRDRRTYGKKGFVGRKLETFLDTAWQRKVKEGHFGMQQNDIEKYRLQTTALLADLHDLSTKTRGKIKPKHDDVVKLVHHVANYMSSVPLKSLLNCLENRDMDPSSRESLVTCLSTVAKYRFSAAFLYEQAKKAHMLRRTSVEQVQLPEEAFQRPPATAFTGTIQSVLPLGSLEVSKGKTTLAIDSLPLRQRIESGLDLHFEDEVNNRLQRSKIHAEIQIAAHYENASPAILPPRVIAASKDACFLCKACISLQGKHSVPDFRGHRGLYPRWRLPTMQQLLPLHQKLNGFLENGILTAMKMMSCAVRKAR